VDENTLTIILVEPQLGQNIGSVARAMLNFGLTDLRIVNPRDGWPNPKALPSAAGADEILEKAKIYTSTLEAIGDLNRLFATSNRTPDMIKSIYTPALALQQLVSTAQQGQKVGILFGGERCGLRNEEISLCEALIRIPTSDDFSSLNLAHAVVIIAHEWFAQTASSPFELFRTGRTRLATREDLGRLFHHLEEELDRTGFLRHPKKRAIMLRNIRNTFQRANLTEQEVRTLRGIIKSLTDGEEKVQKKAS
jgi:tRNA/rRNA methyltransferase